MAWASIAVLKIFPPIPMVESASPEGESAAPVSIQMLLGFGRWVIGLLRGFIEGMYSDDGWGTKFVTKLRDYWELIQRIVEIALNYNAVFEDPITSAWAEYKTSVDFYKGRLNYDYIPIMTAIIFLVVVWDQFHDAIVEKLFPRVIKNVVFTHRANSFTSKLYPCFITLILQPYIIYIYTYLYYPSSVNAFAPFFPPTHHLFVICIMINLVSIFYFSFKYIRAGFDMGSKKISICFLFMVFACFFWLYEVMRVVIRGNRYFFPYKVLYKSFSTRVFVYVYMFLLSLLIYAIVTAVILSFKYYHRKVSYRKPPKDDTDSNGKKKPK